MVFDASALAGAVLRPGRHAAILDLLADPDADVVVPALCDVEVLSALRRVVRTGDVDEARVRAALAFYRSLPVRRFGHEGLLERVFQLRDNFTAYDAVYLALAEGLGAALVTLDRRMADAARRFTNVPILEPGPP